MRVNNEQMNTLSKNILRLTIVFNEKLHRNENLECGIQIIKNRNVKWLI